MFNEEKKEENILKVWVLGTYIIQHNIFCSIYFVFDNANVGVFSFILLPYSTPWKHPYILFFYNKKDTLSTKETFNLFY